VPIPAGSTAIKGLYQSYYTLIGKPYDDPQFSGRSDYQAFIEAGIPSGGLFTGAEQVKTPAQEAIWGGAAGEQFDPWCVYGPRPEVGIWPTQAGRRAHLRCVAPLWS
jgi:Zn-dependent M28 family amino/carboxypeptidase